MVPNPPPESIPNSSKTFNLAPSADPLEPSRAFPGRDEIYRVVSVHKPPVFIRPVAVFLVDYFNFKDTAITNFRVSTIKGPIQHEDANWLMLQWNESALDNEVFAIFKVNIQAGLASTLIHSGLGGEQQDGPRWATSSLAWWVLTMEDLRELLVAGHQVLEVMNRADPEMAKQFFDPAQTECSVQQCGPTPGFFGS